MTEFKEGQTATNPKTGQKIVFRNGDWHSASAPTIPGGIPPKRLAVDAKAEQALAGKARGADAVARQLGVLRQQYDKNFKGVGPGSILEYFPTQQRRQFDSASNAIRPLLKPLIRDPGEGTFTDADQALLDSLIPSGGAYDSDNEQRFSNIEAMINDARKNASKAVSPTIKRIR